MVNFLGFSGEKGHHAVPLYRQFLQNALFHRRVNLQNAPKVKWLKFILHFAAGQVGVILTFLVFLSCDNKFSLWQGNTGDTQTIICIHMHIAQQVQLISF